MRRGQEEAAGRLREAAEAAEATGGAHGRVLRARTVTHRCWQGTRGITSNGHGHLGGRRRRCTFGGQLTRLRRLRFDRSWHGGGERRRGYGGDEQQDDPREHAREARGAHSPSTSRPVCCAPLCQSVWASEDGSARVGFGKAVKAAKPSVQVNHER